MSAFCATHGYNPMRPADLAAAVRQGSSVQSITEHFETVHSVRSLSAATGYVKPRPSTFTRLTSIARSFVPFQAWRLGLRCPCQLCASCNAEAAYAQAATALLRSVSCRKAGFADLVQGSTSRKRPHSPSLPCQSVKPLTSNAQFPDRCGPRIDPVLGDTAGDVHWAVETLLDTKLYWFIGNSLSSERDIPCLRLLGSAAMFSWLA